MQSKWIFCNRKVNLKQHNKKEQKKPIEIKKHLSNKAYIIPAQRHKFYIFQSLSALQIFVKDESDLCFSYYFSNCLLFLLK